MAVTRLETLRKMASDMYTASADSTLHHAIRIDVGEDDVGEDDAAAWRDVIARMFPGRRVVASGGLSFRRRPDWRPPERWTPQRAAYAVLGDGAAAEAEWRKFRDLLGQLTTLFREEAAGAGIPIPAGADHPCYWMEYLYYLAWDRPAGEAGYRVAARARRGLASMFDDEDGRTFRRWRGGEIEAGPGGHVLTLSADVRLCTVGALDLAVKPVGGSGAETEPKPEQSAEPGRSWAMASYTEFLEAYGVVTRSKKYHRSTRGPTDEFRETGELRDEGGGIAFLLNDADLHGKIVAAIQRKRTAL